MSTKPVQEEGCFATTFERKYYHRGNVLIKRSLRPSEFRTGYRGLHVPRLGKERIKNEAESLRFVRQHTDIPVPTVYCDFENDQAYYLITEYIDGVGMSELSEEQKTIVCKELESQIAKLQNLRSCCLGGSSGIVIPPYRVLRQTETDYGDLQPSTHEESVFCHNDLSQQNVIVDLDMLKIRAIIDWEYAGFFLPNFESPFYCRLGPSSAINDEVDDSTDLVKFLHSKAMADEAGTRPSTRHNHREHARPLNQNRNLICAYSPNIALSFCLEPFRLYASSSSPPPMPDPWQADGASSLVPGHRLTPAASPLSSCQP